MLLLCLMVVGVSFSWAENTTYSMTIDSSNNGSNNVHWTATTTSSLTYNDVTWNTSVTGTTSVTASTTYAQIGSKNNPATQVTISTTAFAGKKIVSASLTGYCMSNTGPTLTITAGNTTMLSSAALVKTNSTKYSSTTNNVTLSSDQALTFTISSSAKAAICISGIEVVYTDATVAITAISLDKSSASIGVGGTVTLSPTLTPTNATESVVWSSSDDDVATVVNGVVTGVAEGTATITAASPSDGTIKATCEVTVSAAVAVTSVFLDKTSATLEVGETETLTATVAPADATNKNVTWESSDEDVATVEDGVVTAVGVGSATITVKSAADETKTATCSVTVNPTAVSGVSLNKASTNIKIGKTETLIATVAPANATNKNVTWESSNTSIATVSEAGVVTGVAAGAATITVKSAADNTKTATCEVTIITAGDGSKAKPYDVDEALELISGYEKNNGSATSVYTKGIVSQVGTMYSTTMLNYYISIDGTATNQIQVFRGKNLGNTSFSATTDLSVGDEVIIYGQLYKYGNNEVAEINTGNYLYSLNGVKIPEITFGAASYEVAYNGSLTITATADASGAITFASSDETIAEINATTGVVTPHKAGDVTITANIAASSDNIAGSKTVDLTVTDGRETAGIEFAEATVTKTWGEDFTGQALTNPNDLTVTYESSVPAVATVAADGTVSVLKAGTTVITASFAGNASYMEGEATYTLTVNKAAAGLLFAQTEFETVVDDDAFEAPTLANPNSLTVAYSSSDEDIALVDEEDGTIVIGSKEGTVTITAAFAGNDYYSAGNATYTITVSDPTRKGSKSNPYTVAEVINGTATGSGIYVEGYIVGNYNATTPVNPATGDTNLALADEISETTGSKTIPVELPKGDFRTNWGPSTNNNIGYKVLIKGNIQSYFSVNGLKSPSEISLVSVSVTITAAKYATYCSPHKLDFSATGITVYKAKVNGSVVKMTEISDGIVPANTGVILYKDVDAATTIAVPVTTTDATITDNELVGTTVRTLVAKQSGDNFNYILQNGQDGIVFNMATESGAYMPANRAYLSTAYDASDNGARLMVVFDEGDTTGIDTVNSEKVTANSVAYNLQGRRVVNPKKGGLYIVNGKKIVVK